eukprot:CAMPEP_0197867510 /NCGR_PEP_ID=MMETSP1438-20131217/44792_1 /TAXON_ID=1461541 /ORGANISM="Pterosperma sp., Strain CCMP1384" /LENGTH=246 /DNA_ID=CAMNT_0043486165 /DNA_START=35 /DNA_END=772 /DNA_ORIENTATION=+
MRSYGIASARALKLGALALLCALSLTVVAAVEDSETGGIESSIEFNTDHHIRLDPHIGNTKSHRKVIDHTGGTHPELQKGNKKTVSDDAEHHDFYSMVRDLSLTDAFLSSISMIIVSEIGDETFLIAAIMSMRHPKSIVFSGALSALVIMTILSTGLGLVVPKLITKKTTARLASILYTFFGMRLMYIGMRADPKEKMDAEFEEVEEKLQGTEVGAVPKSALRRFFSRFCTPIFLEAFVLTFLAEW